MWKINDVKYKYNILFLFGFFLFNKRIFKIIIRLLVIGYYENWIVLFYFIKYSYIIYVWLIKRFLYLKILILIFKDKDYFIV